MCVFLAEHTTFSNIARFQCPGEIRDEQFKRRVQSLHRGRNRCLRSCPSKVTMSQVFCICVFHTRCELCCVCSVVQSDRTCVFSILDQQGCGLSVPHWYGLIVGWCLCACVPAGLPAWLASCLPCFPPACSPACPHVSMPACLLACLLACLPACLPALPACLPACAPACSSLCLAFRFPLCLIKRLPVRLLACPSPCLVCLSFLVSRGAVVHRSPRCWVLGLPLLCRFLL